MRFVFLEQIVFSYHFNFTKIKVCINFYMPILLLKLSF
ncbi:hypothetical protein AsAng_0056150 [Aureispira anguillae]|uniref:Uncharacterized protein n=1 Tax=Aureispira anguillae TaxID=2864201 RepID=A0A915YKE7_9BACT|nr:hypothetical protein AsAng_0056150 [Aureispira anguillae]